MKGKKKAKASAPAGKATEEDAVNASTRNGSNVASKRKAKSELEQEPAQKGAASPAANKRKKATAKAQQSDAEEEEVKRLKLPGVRAVLPRIVPWRDWDEWEFVGNALLDGSYAEKTHAVCRVRAWQSRGKVPHSVDATATLVEIALARGQTSPGGLPRSDQELRLMYSMAIVRLVNGIVDAVQQKKYASAVGDLAEKASLPRILVDVRHSASHNQLPSLPILSLAADQAMDWLRTSYWEPQVSALRGATVSLEPHLRNYVRVRSLIVAAKRKRVAAATAGAEGEEGGGRGGSAEEKREQRALELLTTISSTAPPSHLSESLVRPMLAMAAAMLKEAQQDAAETDHATAASTETLEFCASYVLEIWEDAVQRLSTCWPHLRAAIVTALLAALRSLSLFDSSAGIPHHVAGEEAVGGLDGAGEEAEGEGAAAVRAAGTEEGREAWLCLVTSWLAVLWQEEEDANGGAGAGGAGEAERRWGGEWEEMQRRVATACFDAPSVWTRRLLQQVLEGGRGHGSQAVPALALMDALIAAVEGSSSKPPQDGSVGDKGDGGRNETGGGDKGLGDGSGKEKEEDGAKLTLELAEAALAARRLAEPQAGGAQGARVGGAGGGGAWERVRDWHECAIGVVLGGESGLELSESDLSVAAAGGAEKGVHKAGTASAVGGGSGDRVESGAGGAAIAVPAPTAMDVDAVVDGSGEAWWEGDVWCPPQVMERKLLAAGDRETIRSVAARVRILA